MSRRHREPVPSLLRRPHIEHAQCNHGLQIHLLARRFQRRHRLQTEQARYNHDLQAYSLLSRLRSRLPSEPAYLLRNRPPASTPLRFYAPNLPTSISCIAFLTDLIPIGCQIPPLLRVISTLFSLSMYLAQTLDQSASTGGDLTINS